MTNNIEVKCDRCGRMIRGFRDPQATISFYDVTTNHWKALGRPGEQVICDLCMWTDPLYITRHGRRSVARGLIT